MKEVIWDHTYFYQNITYASDNLVIFTLKYNSQSWSGTIHQQLQAAACNSVYYAFVIFCYTDFAHLGFLIQKVLFMFLKHSFWIWDIVLVGRGEEVLSELSFHSDFEKSQHRQKLVQNYSSFASQQGFMVSTLVTLWNQSCLQR